jgi:hypothetical protein
MCGMCAICDKFLPNNNPPSPPRSFARPASDNTNSTSASAAALKASKSATGVYEVDTNLVRDQMQQYREQEKQLLLSNEQIELIRKERILQLAMGEGLTWGLSAAVAGFVGVSVLSFTNPKFRALQISTRVSAPAMLTLGFFSLKYEHAVSRLRREADREGLSNADIQKGHVSTMPVHHMMMNMLYDHPFGLILGVGLPFAGTVFYKQMQLKHITVSQRVMHSRVFAQGGILAIALTTMAFREWMDRRGRFPEVQASSA